MEDGYSKIKKEICINRLFNCRNGNNVVKSFIGIQSQFYRYATICCKLHGDDFDLNSSQYFRAWTIRGTLHIHHIDDYNMVIYNDMLTSYMREFWNNETVLSISEKEFFCEILLDSLKKENLNKKQLIDLCTSNGMTPEKKDYMFNPWGGIPRYLIETGKIVLLCNSENSYMLAPEVELMNREDAEVEQVKRYIEGYNPCTIEDVMYFFKWGKKKSQILTKHVLDIYFADRNVVKKIGNQEYIFIDNENTGSAEEIYVLSAFDPLLLGYEKKSNLFLPKEYLRNVFTAQGIVKPTILYNEKINGLWNIKEKKIYVNLFSNIPEKCIIRIKEILKGVTGIHDIFIDVV